MNMKYVMISLLLVLSACTSSNQYGSCVGLNDVKDSTLQYKYSVNNIFWAIAGIEMIAPPIVVLFNQLECPVGKK